MSVVQKLFLNRKNATSSMITMKERIMQFISMCNSYHLVISKMNHLHQQRSMLYQLAMPFVYNKYAAYIWKQSKSSKEINRKYKII